MLCCPNGHRDICKSGVVQIVTGIYVKSCVVQMVTGISGKSCVVQMVTGISVKVLCCPNSHRDIC